MMNEARGTRQQVAFEKSFWAHFGVPFGLARAHVLFSCSLEKGEKDWRTAFAAHLKLRRRDMTRRYFGAEEKPRRAVGFGQ